LVSSSEFRVPRWLNSERGTLNSVIKFRVSGSWFRNSELGIANSKLLVPRGRTLKTVERPVVTDGVSSGEAAFTRGYGDPLELL